MDVEVNQVVALRDERLVGVYQVKRVETTEVAYLVDVNEPDSVHYVYAPTKLLCQVPQLAGDEVWIEVALLVGVEVQERMTDDRRPLDDQDRTAIRTKCYRLLGGNGIKIVEDTKQRVRDLILRAEERVVAN